MERWRKKSATGWGQLDKQEMPYCAMLQDAVKTKKEDAYRPIIRPAMLNEADI